jgi:hypothetical protein
LVFAYCKSSNSNVAVTDSVNDYPG